MGTRLIPWILLLTNATACSFEKLAADNMVGVLEKSRDEFNRRGIPRAGREAAPGMLALLDGILAASPENQRLLLLKAELAAGFGFGMIEDEYRRAERARDEDKAAEYRAWADELYASARAAARKAFMLRDETTLTAIEKGDVAQLPAVLKTRLDEADVPAAFWLAFAWGAAINLNIDKGPDVTKDVPRVRALMEWVVSVNEGFFDGGPHLFLGLINVAVGRSLGGRTDLAVQHFDAVDRLTKGRFLMAKVIRAEKLLPQIQTPEGNPTAEARQKAARKVWDSYFEILDAVLKAPPDLWPERRLLNAIARQRAQDLYFRADDYLIPPPGVKAPRRDGDESEDAKDEKDK